MDGKGGSDLANMNTRHAHGGSSDEEDEVFFFNNEMNNLTFVSDEDDSALHAVGTGAGGPSDHLPKAIRQRIHNGETALEHQQLQQQQQSNLLQQQQLEQQQHQQRMSGCEPVTLPGLTAHSVGYPSLVGRLEGPPQKLLSLSPEALSMAAYDRRTSVGTHTSLLLTPSPHANSQVLSGSHMQLLGPDGNTYAAIVNPPTSATTLDFRRFYADDDEVGPATAASMSVEQLIAQEKIPDEVLNEESAGIFMGQLPSSYSESDIKLLLKALARASDLPIDGQSDKGHPRKRYVEVRDVKCHARDKTCAFIMVNASSLLPILDFTKRVLCDVNCVYICDRDKKNEINNFVAKFPRDVLKGVPKAALVLEKLTPQGKSGGHGGKGYQHGQQHGHGIGSPHAMGGGNGGISYMVGGTGMGLMPGGMPPGAGFPNVGSGYAISPLGGRAPNPTAAPFVPSSLFGGFPGANIGVGGVAPVGMYVGATGAGGGLSAMSYGQLQAQQPQLMSFSGFPGALNPNIASASASALSGPGGSGSGLGSASPLYLGAAGTAGLQLPGYLDGSTSIASMEAANQALIAASRYRQNSTNGSETNRSMSVTTPSTQQQRQQQQQVAARETADGSQAPRLRPVEPEGTSTSPHAGAGRARPVSVPSKLEGIKCSCGHELKLSQVVEPEPSEDSSICEMCKTTICKTSGICYTCPEGHIYVCSSCGLRHAQRLREKQERVGQQAPSKPKFTLVGLDDAALDAMQLEGSSGDTPSATAGIDSKSSC